MAGHSPVYICCNDIYIDKNSIKAYIRTRDVLPVVLIDKNSIKAYFRTRDVLPVVLKEQQRDKNEENRAMLAQKLELGIDTGESLYTKSVA